MINGPKDKKKETSDSKDDSWNLDVEIDWSEDDDSEDDDFNDEDDEDYDDFEDYGDYDDYDYEEETYNKYRDKEPN
jgi:hypothetical protein